MERPPTHAGSWYPSNTQQLAQQLARTLPQPIPNCKIIVSPHAGYKYCSDTMLPAYHSLDFPMHDNNSNAQITIFILGPSHHIYFKNKMLLSKFTHCQTPFGPLAVDTQLTQHWTSAYPHLFKYMDPQVDTQEHSLEMQFSILYHTLQQRHVPLGNVKIVPIMISYGAGPMFSHCSEIIADYMHSTPHTYMVISSDFCHWGRRFEYTGYVGSRDELKDAMDDETEIEMLTSRSKLSHHQIPIWSSIDILDHYAMDILQCNDPLLWNKYLDITGNTICGRMPLECLLYILKYLHGKHHIECTWGWNKYSQSSHVNSINESSVSYSSGHITLLYN